MRYSVVLLVLVLASVAGSAALVAARQQPMPGMSTARFYILNKTADEAVPVTAELSAASITALKRTQPVQMTVQAWDYREVLLSAGNGRLDQLNVLGTAGWEAISVTTDADGKSTVLLKRPR